MMWCSTKIVKENVRTDISAVESFIAYSITVIHMLIIRIHVKLVKRDCPVYVSEMERIGAPAPFLLTWINVNPSVDKWSHAQ